MQCRPKFQFRTLRLLTKIKSVNVRHNYSSSAECDSAGSTDFHNAGSTDFDKAGSDVT